MLIGGGVDATSQVVLDNKKPSEISVGSVALGATFGAATGGSGAIVGTLTKEAGKQAVKQIAVRGGLNGVTGGGLGAVEAAVRGEDVLNGAAGGAAGGAGGSMLGDAFTAIGKKIISIVGKSGSDKLSTLSTKMAQEVDDFKPMNLESANSEEAIKASGLTAILTVDKDTSGSVLGTIMGQAGGTAIASTTTKVLNDEEGDEEKEDSESEYLPEPVIIHRDEIDQR